MFNNRQSRRRFRLGNLARLVQLRQSVSNQPPQPQQPPLPPNDLQEVLLQSPPQSPAFQPPPYQLSSPMPSPSTHLPSISKPGENRQSPPRLEPKSSPLPPEPQPQKLSESQPPPLTSVPYPPQEPKSSPQSPAFKLQPQKLSESPPPLQEPMSSPLSPAAFQPPQSPSILPPPNQFSSPMPSPSTLPPSFSISGENRRSPSRGIPEPKSSPSSLLQPQSREVLQPQTRSPPPSKLHPSPTHKESDSLPPSVPPPSLTPEAKNLQSHTSTLNATLEYQSTPSSTPSKSIDETRFQSPPLSQASLSESHVSQLSKSTEDTQLTSLSPPPSLSWCKTMNDQDGDWNYHLRILSNSARDSTDPASDPSVLQSVKKLHGFCKLENSDDLVARIYPQINKVFQRSVASLSQSESGTAKGLLLLAILQFFLDFGDMVLHDADPSLRTFFRSCLSREFSDAAVAEATCEFLTENKRKILASFPNLLPQFFPLLLKLIAWNWEKLEKSFLKIFPGLISPGSFLPLFPSILDLPMLVVALEKVERSSGSGSRVGGSIASIQKSAAPEMLLALMDEAYTGSTIGDGGDDSESEDNNTIDVADPLFLELLKDENDGLAERHRPSPALNAALQAAASGPRSERMKQTLKIAPRLLDVYFSVTLRDANDSLICALIPLLMTRNSTMFPDKNFSHEIRRRLLEFVLAAFQRSPNFIALLKKPIIDRLGEAYDDPAKRELALQLCWAIGEYGGGGESHKEAARELFESLELLLYENLSSSRLGLRQESGNASRRTTQSRLLCFVVTAIAKLATYHRELLPRARVALGKVVRSRISDARVWRRAHDYLGLMNEPGICWSVLGPSRVSEKRFPGTVNWSEGGDKMVAHIPFHILSEQGGPPFHDFALSDVIIKN